MKLIDLLVQELPKRGGWPDGYDVVSTNGYGAVWAYKTKGRIVGRELHFHSATEGYVTREQYEAALNKLVWNGEGLPPVGCECEYSLNSGGSWFKCKIDYILGTQGLIMLADVFEGGQWVSFHEYDGKLKFRPIRSERDKERDEAIAKITDAICGEIPDTGMATAAKYAVRAYDAIARGDIPGVKLSD